MNPILLQALYYAIVLLLGILLVAALQRNWFWVWLRVRVSFDKYVLVKVRNVARDYGVVGHIEDGRTLVVHMKKGQERRVVIPEGVKVFYKFLGVQTVDYDDEKNAICTADYTPVSGFDAERYNDLFKRALKKPALQDPVMRWILILSVVTLLASIAAVFTAAAIYKQEALTQQLISQLGEKIQSGTIIGGGAL